MTWMLILGWTNFVVGALSSDSHPVRAWINMGVGLTLIVWYTVSRDDEGKAA